MIEKMAGELWLIRHGETEWSLSGAHTGRTDLPLTHAGENNAARVGRLLAGHNFDLILTSPLQRARRTCELAGYGDRAVVEPNLAEWDYGSYEGRTTTQIQKERPGWSLFRDGVPGGETIEQVAARMDTFCEFWRRVGLACRRKAPVTSRWVRRASRNWDMNGRRGSSRSGTCSRSLKNGAGRKARPLSEMPRQGEYPGRRRVPGGENGRTAPPLR